MPNCISNSIPNILNLKSIKGIGRRNWKNLSDVKVCVSIQVNLKQNEELESFIMMKKRMWESNYWWRIEDIGFKTKKELTMLRPCSLLFSFYLVAASRELLSIFLYSAVSSKHPRQSPDLLLFSLRSKSTDIRKF